jgi:hypothetical protein
VYGGDANYQPSNSAPTTLQLKFPAPSLVLTPPSETATPGQSTTIVATWGGANKTIAPTGAVTFVGGITQLPVAGNVAYTTTTDADGNAALQATLMFSPTYSDQYYATYAGDANYPSVAGGLTAAVNVQGSDFRLVTSQSSSLTIPSPGLGERIFLAVAGQSNYAGTVNFSGASCAGLPRETTCVFDPPSITGTNFTGLTITTQAPQAIARPGHGDSHGFRGKAASLGIPFAALLLGTVSFGKQLRNRLFCLLAFALALTLVSCGGGGFGGGGSTDPGTPVGTYTVTVTATSGSLTHSVSFPLTVN